MSISKFPCMTISLFCKRRPFLIFGQFRNFLKETSGKNWVVCAEKEREKNTNGQSSKIFSSSNMGTKKCDQKERARVNFQIQNL